MGRSEAAGRGRRGAHRSEPENSGPLATVGHVLESTVPKRVRPPRLLSVLVISGVMIGLVLFGYSTTQIYLRFSEPPVEHGAGPAPGGALDSAPSPDAGGGRDDTTSQTGAEQPGEEPGRDGGEPERSPEAAQEEDGAAAAGTAGAVSYSTVESSESNFTGRVTVTNTGDGAMDGWELVLGFSDATVTSAWDVEWEATSDGVVARQPAWSGGIAPGESVTVSFTAEGSAQEPTSCTLNGAPCS
ncbi:cellulose binding domain-containing protein [Nocardiopsis sp. CNT-189]|uniref:cellulose binding domain-containing protein n=1 Tax=Nocardiopsis oceanisediminis TaxID=2816862 RepID=UPI003B34F439